MSITQITESEAIHISTNATQSSVTNKGSKISLTTKIYPPDQVFLLYVTSNQDQLNMLDTMRTSKIKIKESVWIPQEYNLVEIFSEKKANTLPSHRCRLGYSITLEEGSKSVHGSIYNLSERELSVLKSYIEDYLPKG